VAKEYDVTFKHLVEAHPAEWLALSQLPAGKVIEVRDADLSTVSAAADKVLLVQADPAYVAHLEFQAGIDRDLDLRALLYNVMLRWRHRLPVRTVVILLTPRALASSLTGNFRDVITPDCSLDFSYRIVRVWEQPVEQLLTGGLGTLPLAPISAVREDDLPRVIRRMHERISAEASPAEADIAWSSTLILSGLRYRAGFMAGLLEGVWNMQESATYQAIIERGRAEGLAEGREQGREQGRLQEARNALLLIGTERFGVPDSDTDRMLNSIGDLGHLEQLFKRVITAGDWKDLLS
jgi:predicted transposase YdaD